MNSGVIFVAGCYGVGKSTLCDKLSQRLSIPFYSAGDLISEINGESYGANKAVKDKDQNQQYLIDSVEYKMQVVPVLLLAGHFCIFNKLDQVERLPENVFNSLKIKHILLLEADTNQIIKNLYKRDSKCYSSENITLLQAAEQHQALKIAASLSVPITIHQMKFNDSDVDELLMVLRKE